MIARYIIVRAARVIATCLVTIGLVAATTVGSRYTFMPLAYPRGTRLRVPASCVGACCSAPGKEGSGSEAAS